jgi:endonuclease-8
VLELSRDGASFTRRLGPDILAQPPNLEEMLGRLRAAAQDREVGDALLDQRLVSGIGNIWRAESLWDVRLSPWRSLADVSDIELGAVLQSAHEKMRTSVEGTQPLRHVYRRAGRPCRRCGTLIRSHGQGEAARLAYWCPGCQRGGREPAAL